MPGRGCHSFKMDAQPPGPEGAEKRDREGDSSLACRPSYHGTRTPSSTSHGPHTGFAAGAITAVCWS